MAENLLQSEKLMKSFSSPEMLETEDKKKDGNDKPICKTEKETQMYRTNFWTLWEKARVGCFERTASKHVYNLGWNRTAAQAGCMRQVLGPGALGRPRGIE